MANYNSVNEIFNNYSGSNLESVYIGSYAIYDHSIPLQKDFFFNKRKIDRLYIKSSYIYFNNDIDPFVEIRGIGTYMHYLAWEEGTLNNKEKFIRIHSRLSSKNYIQSSSSDVFYKCIIWENGDVDLYCEKKGYSSSQKVLVAKQQFAVQLNTYAGFKREYKTYHFQDGLQERTLSDTRFLIESDGKYYTIKNERLEEITNATLSKQTFLNFGAENLDYLSLAKNLPSAKLLYWNSEDIDPNEGMYIYGVPELPQYVYYDIAESESAIKINKIEFSNASPSATFSCSTDNGETWYYYKDSHWEQVQNEEGTPCVEAIFILKEDWEALSVGNAIKFRIGLNEEDFAENLLVNIE